MLHFYFSAVFESTSRQLVYSSIKRTHYFNSGLLSKVIAYSNIRFIGTLGKKAAENNAYCC